MLKRSIKLTSVVILLVFVLGVVSCSKKSRITGISGTLALPEISNVSSSSITESSATITWTTATEANSLVEYGTSIGYGTYSTKNSSYIVSHSVNLTGLEDATEYHYRVISTDPNNNQGISGDNTFTTQSGGGGTGSVLYDFEDISNPGWINDTTEDFGDCFGIPDISTDYAYNGAKSLAVPFDMTKLDTTWDCLNDAIYARPSGLDFTHMSKLTIYMYIPASADSDIIRDIEATVYMKTGAWYWYESDKRIEIIPGIWNEVSIDFSNARHDDIKGLTIEHLDDIKEIGVHLGNGEGITTTTFYIDDVTVE